MALFYYTSSTAYGNTSIQFSNTDCYYRFTHPYLVESLDRIIINVGVATYASDTLRVTLGSTTIATYTLAANLDGNRQTIYIEPSNFTNNFTPSIVNSHVDDIQSYNLQISVGYSSTLITSQSYPAQITFIYTQLIPTITYSDSTLSLSQSGYTITATKGGNNASVNDGSTISYYLYEDSTQVASFTGDTATVTLDDNTLGSHTYNIVATSSSNLSTTGASASITAVHTITWSNPSLSLIQNNLALTAIMEGQATDNLNKPITYYLYEGSTLKGTFINSVLAIALNNNELGTTHTYKVVAASTITSDGASRSIALVTPSGTVGIFIEATVEYYDGTFWETCDPLYYDGTSWVECSL